MLMPGRKYNAGNGYRYGFNGKENDNEVKGEANQQDYGMRIYDPRLGRFLSVDPLFKSFAMLTPYQFASNTPIAAIDLDGLEAKIVTTYSYTDSKGTLTKRITEKDVNNPFNIGTGVLNIAINYKNVAPITEASTVAKYIPQTFMSKALKVSTWFGERKNEFGFVLTGNGNGTSVDMGSDGVQFKESLDMNIMLGAIGNFRDLGGSAASISDFMKSSKFKMWYDVVDNSLKLGSTLSDAMEAPGKMEDIFKVNEEVIAPRVKPVELLKETKKPLDSCGTCNVPKIDSAHVNSVIRAINEGRKKEKK